MNVRLGDLWSICKKKQAKEKARGMPSRPWVQFVPKHIVQQYIGKEDANYELFMSESRKLTHSRKMVRNEFLCSLKKRIIHDFKRNQQTSDRMSLKFILN